MFRSFSKKKATAAITAAATIAMAPLTALHAQSITMPVDEIKSQEATEAKASEPATDAKVEKVVVTGSHIRRIDTEGVSPIVTINRKELEKSGYNSVSDVLRDNTMNSFGSMREASGSNAAGNAEINLRGLGSSNTLVLLNGQRLPSDAVTGAVDLNMIPMAAVERIEVLKDGASAIYGSDALGGVVNIITRKDFSGTQASLTQTTPALKGGRRRDLSVVNGVNFKRGNMVNVAQYRENEAIYSRDRKWTSNGMSPIGDIPSYRNGDGPWIADSACPASQLRTDGSGQSCQFRFSDYSTELPELKQFSLMSESNVQLNSRVKLVGRLGGTQKLVKWQFAPAPGVFTIPGSQSGNGPGQPGQDLDVRYRLTGLGPRQTEVTTYGYNALLGANVELNDKWQLDVTTAQNGIEGANKGVNGYALTKDVNAAIESGQCNPFNGGQCDLRGIRYQPTERTSSQLSSVEVKATGTLAEMPSGDLALAVGTSYTFQKFRDIADPKTVNGEVFGDAGSTGGGQRDSRAAFTELDIPITRKLELQLAGRYDQYSDFGDSANPKAAAVYRASEKVLFRTSAGTGFKAPLMQDLYASQSVGFPSFIDAVACKNDPAACKPQQYQVIGGGNKDLKAEKSISYTAGTVIQPTRNLSLGSDLFLTKLKNVVGLDLGDATRAEDRFGSDYLRQRGVIIDRDGTGHINSVTAPLQNLSSQEITGLDLSIGYRFSKFRLSNEHSRLFYFKEEGFPGLGMTNKLGDAGKPIWRNAASLTYNPGERHDLTLTGLTTAGQRKEVAGTGKTVDYTTYDLMYAYKSKNLGKFTAGIKNLLNTRPPLDDSKTTGQLDVALYDQIGQQVFTGYEATF